MKRGIAAGITATTLALLLTACGQGEPQTAQTVTVTATATVTASPSPTSSEAQTANEAGLSSRGAQIMEVGDSDGVEDAAGNDLLTFTVNSIEVDPKCTGRERRAPEHGHFVVFDAELEVTKEAAGVLSTPINMFNVASYRVIDAEGNTLGESPNTGPAHSCFPEGEMLPYDIGPGEKGSGKVVFDVPVGTGVLLTEFDDAPDVKWEWSF